MKSCSLVTLESLCESVKYGYTASASDMEVGPKFLRITDIVPSSIDWEAVPFCKIEDNDKQKFSLLPGDILVARTGATVGYAKLIKNHVDAVFASYLVRFRIDARNANPAFVGQLVESSLYKKYVQSRVGGAAQPNANAKVLGSFKFNLPSKYEQERISSILERYAELVENNTRQIQLLEEGARQLYTEWFVRLRFPGHEMIKVIDRVPEGFFRKSLSDFCQEKRDMVMPERLNPETPYIGLEHMPRRSITLGDWEYADKVSSSKHKFQAGDILFGKIRPYFHKVGITFTDGIASSDAIVMRPLRDYLLPFLLMTVSSDAFIAMTSKTVKEGSKMPRADWEHMQRYPVLSPPEELLTSFNMVIEPIMEQLKTLVLMSKKLREARDILLPRLMSGDIRV